MRVGSDLVRLPGQITEGVGEGDGGGVGGMCIYDVFEVRRIGPSLPGPNYKAPRSRASPPCPALFPPSRPGPREKGPTPVRGYYTGPTYCGEMTNKPNKLKNKIK